MTSSPQRSRVSTRAVIALWRILGGARLNVGVAFGVVGSALALITAAVLVVAGRSGEAEFTANMAFVFLVVAVILRWVRHGIESGNHGRGKDRRPGSG